MKQPPVMGWKLEIALATVFLVLAAIWASRSEAGEYQGTYHRVPKAEQIIKREGLVMYRLIDGPVRCYWIVKEVRMIGAQVTLSCVIPDKENENDEQQPQPREGG